MSEKWDKRFLEMAALVATWSKDRSTKMGCVIVGPDKEVITVGYNGFPRGVNDDVDERHNRPDKYIWTEHAERNAIFNAARMGVSTEGCTIYLLWFPCMDCCRGIVQAEIKRVVCQGTDETDPERNAIFHFDKVREMLAEAGVEFVTYPADAED